MTLTGTEAHLIAERINDLHRAIDGKFEAVHASIEQLHRTVDKVETQTRATNGRVSKLEIWQATVGGIRLAFKWLPGLLIGTFTAMVTAGITALVTILLTH